MVSNFEFADHVVGLLIKSDIDEKVFEEIREVIRSKISAFEKINLFLEIEKGNNVSMKAVIKHLKFSYENAENFNKIAVVSSSFTLKNALMIKDLLIDAEVKSFSHEERLEAIQWIAQ